MPIASLAAGSLGSFILHADCLPLPGAAHIALQRVCFDPAAFKPACYEQAGILLPASLQRAAPKRLGEFLAGRLAAREALRLADLRYRSGIISFIEVLDAQRQLFAAETEWVSSILERRLAYSRIYLALGGGWEEKED